MSVELETANAIRSLVENIEAVTGESHYDLTSAVQALKNGYGQGGDSKFKEYNAGTLISLNATDFGDATQIRQYQFVGLTSLTNVEIPDDVTNIGPGAFNGCTEIEYLKMPISATLGNNAFLKVANVKTMEFSVGTGIAPDYTSSTYKTTPWCLSAANITELIIQEGVTKIGKYMFRDLTALKRILIPSTVNDIGSYSFYGCSVLEEIVLPNGLAKIEEASFRNCSKLTRVWIPKTVTYIDVDAFMSCPSSMVIYYEGTEEEWNNIEEHVYGTGIFDSHTIHYNSTGLPE